MNGSGRHVYKQMIKHDPTIYQSIGHNIIFPDTVTNAGCLQMFLAEGKQVLQHTHTHVHARTEVKQYGQRASKRERGSPQTSLFAVSLSSWPNHTKIKKTRKPNLKTHLGSDGLGPECKKYIWCCCMFISKAKREIPNKRTETRERISIQTNNTKVKN